MSRTLQEAKIAGRAERRRLTQGVHWRGIDPDVHLGYRKGPRGGSWLVRWYAGGAYRQRTLGTADDELNVGTFDYGGAVNEARRTVEIERRTAQAVAAGPVLTVRTAIKTYTAVRDARASRQKGFQTRSDAASRLSRHVIGYPSRGRRAEISASPLAEVPLHLLNETDLIDWRRSLSSALKGTTKQRLINDLKAALNAAYLESRTRLPINLPLMIKHGLAPDVYDVSDDRAESVARENQILSDAEVTRLIRAAKQVDADHGWEGDLFRLVVLLAATGARFSQIVRLKVADVQAPSARILMPASRKGKNRHRTAVPVPVGRDVLEAVAPCLMGRQPDETLLERWRNKQVPGAIRWQRDGRHQWRSPSELIRPWALIRISAGLSDVIPYALRHSSIVRGLRANLPIRLVAALHDTSVTMIERHYGRYIADGLDELAARSVVPLI